MFARPLLNLSESESSPLVSGFYKHATTEPGLVISICQMNPSGCHDAGTSLKAEFQNLDYAGVNLCCGTCGNPPVVFKEPAMNAKKWENLFVTGCAADMAAYVVKSLKGKYDFSAVKNIFIVSPPHLERLFDIDYQSRFIRQILSFSDTPYKINLLTSGVDSGAHSIGLPKQFPILASKYEVPAGCFGLMYNRHLSSFLAYEGQAYANAYFSQVAIASKNCKEAFVIAIGIPGYAQDYFTIEAERHGLSVKFVDRLSQADFLELMRKLAVKGGIISCDGAYTLIQAFNLGVRPLYFNNSANNTLFCIELIEALPEKMQPIAKIILGQAEDCSSVMKNGSEYEQVFQALRSVFQKGLNRFQAEKLKAEAKPVPMALECHSAAFSASFGIAIKEQLKRITGIDWHYAKSTEMAHVTGVDKEKINRIKDCLASFNIDLIEKTVADTKQPIYMIDCANLSVSTLKEIDSLVLRKKFDAELMMDLRLAR